ncbi:hypothetical protein Tco_1410294 [Tanacetum coccineum]
MSTSNTHQQSLADAGSETRPPSLERGPYEFKNFTPPDSQSPRLQKEDDLTGDDLKHYEAEIEAMNLILISIPNGIYNSVDAYVNSGSVEYDNNVQASNELEQLARNAYKEAEKQQINANKDILDDATKSQIKMENKLKDPIAIEKKQNVRTIDYNKLNDIYEDFIPQKEVSAEQKKFSSTFIPSENPSNARTSTSPSEIKPPLSLMPRLKAAPSVRRPLNRDSSFKNCVLSNTKKSSEKVEVFDRTNKKIEVAFANVVLHKNIVTDVVVKNTLKARNVLCVSCAKNVLIMCHDKCIMKPYLLRLEQKHLRL